MCRPKRIRPETLSLGVAGLVDTGIPNADQIVDVAFYALAGETCDTLAGSTLLGTSVALDTNANGIAGFAIDGLENVDEGTLVAAVANLEETGTSALSNCVVAEGNNTSWHNARELVPQSPVTGTGFLRSSGQARWFKVPILPNSRLDIRLRGLPADYDLLVFRDIQGAYDDLLDGAPEEQGPNLALDDLRRAGAETPGDVFNTSQYNKSAWDATNWDPAINSSDRVSPSEWSPSEWSPSEWSASQWSPSEWSPSEWSPSEWSPSEWSPSEWSPSEWSASQWSPSEWSSSNPADPRAFSVAQSKSLVAVSAGTGTADETVSINTWNNTGHFYMRVQGKNGSFEPEEEFTLEVSPEGNLCTGVEDIDSSPTAPVGDRKTVILVDSSRMQLGPAGSPLRTKLNTFAARNEVKGVIVDLSTAPGGRRAQRPGGRQRRLPVREEPRCFGDQANRRRLPRAQESHRPHAEESHRVRRRGRGRLGDPVLPLSGPRAPRQRDPVHAAGQGQHGVAGEPPARLRPERRLHRLDRQHRAARQRVPGPGPRVGPPGGDAGRDRGDAGRVPRYDRRRDADRRRPRSSPGTTSSSTPPRRSTST